MASPGIFQGEDSQVPRTQTISYTQLAGLESCDLEKQTFLNPYESEKSHRILCGMCPCCERDENKIIPDSVKIRGTLVHQALLAGAVFSAFGFHILGHMRNNKLQFVVANAGLVSFTYSAVGLLLLPWEEFSVVSQVEDSRRSLVYRLKHIRDGALLGTFAATFGMGFEAFGLEAPKAYGAGYILSSTLLCTANIFGPKIVETVKWGCGNVIQSVKGRCNGATQKVKNLYSYISSFPSFWSRPCSHINSVPVDLQSNRSDLAATQLLVRKTL